MVEKAEISFESEIYLDLIKLKEVLKIIHK